MKPSFYQGISSGQINVFSGNNYKVLLPATTLKTLTVPFIKVSGGGQTGANPEVVAVITVLGSATVYVANNATAVIPTSSFIASEGELVNGVPLIKSVTTGDVLSFITSGTDVPVGVAFYLAI